MTVWPMIAVLILFFLGVPCSFAMMMVTIPYFLADPFISMAVVAVTTAFDSIKKKEAMICLSKFRKKQC